jgi:RNA polymerase-binding transcription factor DksA
MNTQPELEERRPPLDRRRIRRSLDEEERRLTRAIADLRIVALDEVPEEHDRGDVAWNSEDAANAASDTLEREVGFGLIQEFQTAIENVHLARQRLLNDHYGVCERCGADIHPARLDAVPATRWCLACASSLEPQNEERRLAAR